MRRALLLVVMAWGIAGCNKLFGLTPTRLQDASVDGPPDAVPPSCPDTYTITIDATPRLFRLSVPVVNDWARAEADCELDHHHSTMPTHLAVLRDDNDRLAIAPLVAANVMDDTWIGLSDTVTDDVFLWVTDEPTNGYPPLKHPPWVSSDPGYVGFGCVDIEYDTTGNTTGQLHDRNCTNGKTYLCECDAFEPDTTHFAAP